jgi:hypothetical protein
MSQFAGGLQANMLGRRLQFEQLAMNKQMAEARLAGMRQNLSLGQRRLGLAREGLRDEAKALNLQMALGLGGALYSGLEGRRRAKKLKAQATAQQKWMDDMSTYFRRNE